MSGPPLLMASADSCSERVAIPSDDAERPAGWKSIRPCRWFSPWDTVGQETTRTSRPPETPLRHPSLLLSLNLRVADSHLLERLVRAASGVAGADRDDHCVGQLVVRAGSPPGVVTTVSLPGKC